MLLFGNSFAAYATAYGLTGGGISLVPIVIGYFFSGDVLDNPHLAEALALGMFVVLILMMAIYIPLNRISSRWVR
jgi:putative spermidine/putrescine transport system permease protein